MKYYLILSAEPITGGDFDTPYYPDWLGGDGPEPPKTEGAQITMKGGPYEDLHMGWGAYFVSERLKEALETRVSEKDAVEFYPIPITSKEYGDRLYYLIHFKKKHNVINWEISKVIPGNPVIPVVGLDKRKVEGLNLFNTDTDRYSLYISDSLYKELKALGLTSGMGLNGCRVK
ncbi:MAG: hypothetical protein LUD17_08190 [Bacteroidales bacterium]|nr:hypothetical protein [Bacteroidales bacterium]